MSDEDKKILVCIRVADTGAYHPRSIKRECSLCHHEVWSTPASIPMLKEGATIVCNRCVAEQLKNIPEEELKVQPITQAQVNEIKEYFDTKSN